MDDIRAVALDAALKLGISCDVPQLIDNARAIEGYLRGEDTGKSATKITSWPPREISQSGGTGN